MVASHATLEGRSFRSLLTRAGVSTTDVANLTDAASKIETESTDATIVICLWLPTDELLNEAQLIEQVDAANAIAVDAIVVAVAESPSVRACMAAARAGVADIVDVAIESPSAIAQRWPTMATRQRSIATALLRADVSREVLHDLLRELVRTERRVVDLEERIAQRPSARNIRPTAEVGRTTTVLVVESDRELANQMVAELERIGLSTFAFLSGEDAVHEVAQLIQAGAWFDLALISVRLPGIDGFETIRRLRGVQRGLTALVMTDVTDLAAAIAPADVEVVAVVTKPIENLADFSNRVGSLAANAAQHTREEVYLRRIKERHDDVLTAYRQLVTDE